MFRKHFGKSNLEITFKKGKTVFSETDWVEEEIYWVQEEIPKKMLGLYGLSEEIPDP